MKKDNLAKKLGAYSLAAGAAVLATQAVPANAAMNVFNNGGAGWYDSTSNWEQDMISFKMDGTVVTNSANTGVMSLGQDADSFTFQERSFMWYGTDHKLATTLATGDGTSSNTGYVAGNWYGGSDRDCWNVGRLGGGFEISGDPLADGRRWSDATVTDTGGLGGWNFYFHGEWPFGGGGIIGLYADVGTDRFYGWASIQMWSYNAVKLHEFAFSDVPGLGVYAGGGEMPLPFIEVDMDIKFDKKDDPDIVKPLNLASQGKLPITVYSTAELDLTGIDPGSLRLNGAAPAQDADGNWLVDFEDVDGDGMDDLVAQFDLQSLGIIPGMTELDLTGELLDGTSIVAADVFRLVPDFNGDMAINATDLAIMKANFGSQGPFPAPLGSQFGLGDANGDGLVNATDLAILRQSFGAFGAEAGDVPEPVTLSLLALGAVGVLARRKRA